MKRSEAVCEPAAVHGGDIYSFARRLGIRPADVIDFSSNINHHAPGIGKVCRTIDLRPYADPTYRRLKRVLSEKYGVAPEQIALFNGASSAIATLMQHAEEVVLYAPAYGEYRRFAKRVVLIDRFREIYTPSPEHATVVFVNPATPDGRCYDLEPLFAVWQARNNHVIVDESFLEFADAPSATRFLQQYERLTIVKSLTKFYACAGVRVGVVISSEERIGALEAKQPMWPLSTFDAAYIEAVVQKRKYHEKVRCKIAKEKAFLHAVLSESPLIDTVYPSDANFFLTRLRGIDAEALQRRCDAEAILIRNCASFDFLDATHVRFAVRGKKDCKKLRKVLHA